MKVAVFGWYGHENAGDERIKFCLSEFLTKLGGVTQLSFYDLHENAIKGMTSKFDAYDLIIIGGGGLILSQHNYHDFIHGLGTKVVTLGVSVEGDLVGNRGKFAQALVTKSEVVLVRDTASYEKLKVTDKENKVKVSYDLTFLDPYAVVNNNQKTKLGINLFPKVLERQSLISKLLGKPKVISFNSVVEQLKQQFYLLPIPLYCVKQQGNLATQQMNDINFMRQYFANVPNNFSADSIDDCKMFISMRLHGAIFAIQKGIPVITFSIFPKQINFMREVGIEHMVVDTDDLQALPKIISYVEKNENKILQKIIEYRDRAVRQVRHDLIEVMNLI